jgi:general secretion pathway protein D
MSVRKQQWYRLLTAVLLIGVWACSPALYRKGHKYYQHEMYDKSVMTLEEAHQKNPEDLKIRTLLMRAKLAASEKHFANAKKALADKDYQTAYLELQKTLFFDPSNQYARDTLNKVANIIQAKEKAAREKQLSLEQLKHEADEASHGPMLDPSSNIPIVLKFNNAPLKTVLDAMSKASGINFLYDDRTDKEKRISIDVSNISLEEALNYLMMQSKNFYKVLDPHTLIIVPDTKQKRDEYEDKVIRTFYLSNADAKDVFQLVRSILQTRRMAMNQDLNSITIEDTPEKVALAEKIIAANDKSKGEVVVDVELLEVNSNLLRDLGVQIFTGGGAGADQSVTIGPQHNTTDKGIGFGPPVSTGQFFNSYRSGMRIYPLPNFVINWLLTNSETQILARPQLRVMEGQKATVHIGDKIPVPTANLSYPSTTTGTSFVPMTSYTYQDVGVKITIEPRVHHNREISIKLKAEVSSVTGEVAGSGLTPSQPIIGTRDVSTDIRLGDGETSLISGLIRQSDSKSYTGVPGFGKIPILRRLFGSTSTKRQSTDVVVLLTPHIVRMPNITEANMKAIWIGSEATPFPIGGAASQGRPTPFGTGRQQPPPTPPPSALPGLERPEGKPAQAEKPPAQEESQQKPTPGQEMRAGRILISPSSLNVAPGGQAVLNLVMIGAKDLKDLTLQLQYPRDLLSVEGTDEGTFFKIGGGTSRFSAQQASPGLLVIRTGREGKSGSSGSGLIARIRFKALKPGQAAISLDSGQGTLFSGETASVPGGSASITVGK